MNKDIEELLERIRKGCEPCPRCKKVDCEIQAAHGRAIDASQELYEIKEERDRLLKELEDLRLDISLASE